MARDGSIVSDLVKTQQANTTVAGTPRHSILDFEKDENAVVDSNYEDPEVGAILDSMKGNTTVIPKTSNTRSTIAGQELYSNGIPIDQWRKSTRIENHREETKANWDETAQSWLDVAGLNNQYFDRYGADEDTWPKQAKVAQQMAVARLHGLVEKHGIDWGDMASHLEEHYPETMSHRMKKSMIATMERKLLDTLDDTEFKEFKKKIEMK